jgi:hypothetical protein
MGMVAPIIGVVSAVGGAIQSANAASAQNAANAMQIEANNREESIRLMDVEAQRQSNFLDFELGSQQRLAQLASSLSAAEIARTDARTQRAIQNSQITSAQSAITTAATKGEVDRTNAQQNSLSQAAQARGIDIQGVPYDKLAGNVVTQRAALMAALNPMMADMYRDNETAQVLNQFDTLRSAEGDQAVQLDYAKQYGALLEGFGNLAKQTGDTNAAYQQVGQQNSLNASDAMQRNAYAVNDSLFGTTQEMQSIGSQIDQLSAYRKLVGNENLANAQQGNIRSATSAKNADVSRSNRNYSIFDSLGSIAGAGISLFNSLGSSQAASTPQPQAPVGLRVSDSRYDPSYRYTQDGGYFG